MISQSLVAAQRTVEGARFVHSLHCYFMLPGDPAVPTHLPGGPLARWRLVHHAAGDRHPARQRDLFARVLFPCRGRRHGAPDADAARRAAAGRAEDAVRADRIERPRHTRRDPASSWARERPLEIKPVHLAHYVSREKLAPVQHVWVRMTGEVPGRSPPADGHPCLSFGHDLAGHLNLPPRPVRFRPADPDGEPRSRHVVPPWPCARTTGCFYTADSPNSIGSRGFARGLLYARDGTLVASTAQEGLVAGCAGSLTK